MCATEEEALRLKKILQRRQAQAATKTWQEVLEEYETYMIDKGNKPGSIKTTVARLRRFLGDARLAMPSVPFSQATAEALYAELRQRPSQYGRHLSVSESRACLAAMKTMGRWLVRRGMWKESTLDAVEAIGRANRGKPQLRLDEARRWLTLAYQRAEAGDAGAVAALMAFLMGMRASEVVDRVARDLDDGGRVIWIDCGKTRKARRRLRVPKRLQPLLLRLVDGRDPGTRVFGFTRFAVRDHVRRICRQAGVPQVCAHSMRGLLATLAVEGGEVLARVADALGHESPSMTLSHYAAPGAERQGVIERGGRALEGVE